MNLIPSPQYYRIMGMEKKIIRNINISDVPFRAQFVGCLSNSCLMYCISVTNSLKFPNKLLLRRKIRLSFWETVCISSVNIQHVN